MPEIILGEYSTSVPTLTNKQTAPVQMDVNGNTKITSGTNLNKNDEITANPKGIVAKVIHVQTAVTIGTGVAGDTKLIGIVITKALTGTCAITGLVDDSGAARSITFPAATVAGSYGFFGAVNAAGALTVTCSNASDADLVTVMFVAN